MKIIGRLLLLAYILFGVHPFKGRAQNVIPDTCLASSIMPDHGSVVEGDGMYSIPLGDGRSIFLMGDSYIGDVVDGRRVHGDHMYRNTYSVFHHDNRVSQPFADSRGPQTSAAVPLGVTDENKYWYWPGHGFVVKDKLYVFQFLMYAGDGPDGWNFHFDHTHILQYGLPDFSVKPEKQEVAPCHKISSGEASRANPHIHYGAAALNDLATTGYLYIYAQVDIVNGFSPVTEVHVARTTIDSLFTAWEYYDGQGWTTDQDKAMPLVGLDSVSVSSQFNVFKLGKKYVLLTQDKSWNSGKIYTFIADSPCGPWTNGTLIYKIPSLPDSRWYTYNAMAHPQFGKDGCILVSYNVNTSLFSQQKDNVWSYRPRFIWVKKDKILQGKR